MTPTAATQDIIYNSLDNMQTMALKELFDEGLLPEWAQHTYRYSEKMLGPMLTMMRRGVRIDLAQRDKFVDALQARAKIVRHTYDSICEGLFGTTINPNSFNQLQFLFYTLLGIPEQTKSKKGEVKVGTDREILERIARDYPRGAVFANLIVRIREIEKQIEFLTKSLSPEGRFHTSYNISGTETFRLSSSEHPLRIGSNQQNVPPDARPCFVADPGYLFFQADQQGAEARLVAYRSGDENYIAACEGGDSHTMVAAMVFGFEPLRELAEREYRRGKSYRQTAKGGAHGCLTGDHEVLTPDGWVPIHTKPPVIAQWSPASGGTITWGSVRHWTTTKTNTLVSIEGPSMSFLGTEDHRILVDNDGRWVERTAATLKKSDRIPYTGIWESGHTHEPERARIVAAYQADGSFSGKNLRFKFRRARKIVRMQKLLAEAGISYTEKTIGKDTNFLLNVLDSRIIASYGKVASPALLGWNANTLAAFVEETLHWDGTVGANNRRAVCSVNLQHCQNLQTLYQFAGYGSKVIDNTGKTRTNAFGRQRPHWVSMNNRKFASVSSCKIRTLATNNREVYCPTVETTYFMVRRQGHVYVTGNSNYMGKPYTLAKQMGVDTETAEQFQVNYFKKFPGIVKWHAHVAHQLQTQGWLENPFGMRRTFWGRRWDDTTLREAIAFYPQSAVGVLTNIVLYKLWARYEGQPGAPVQILMNGHDAVIGQIREDLAATLIPEVLQEMRFPFEVLDIHGKVRAVEIPFDMEVGRNWGKYDPTHNPEGLKKWKPHEA
jgi:DNA polymerase I-like protein with 3'-5' exonuclease and polymerase domains